KMAEAETEFLQAIKLKPDDVGAHSGLGRTYARWRKWDKAAAEFAQAVKLNPGGNVAYLYWSAALSLQAGDVERHRRACREILDRFGQPDTPGSAAQIALVCLLTPDAAGDLERVLKLADRAVTRTESQGPYGQFRLIPALADYRASRHAEAVKWLKHLAPKA